MAKTQLFISYKTGMNDGLTASANGLRQLLEQAGYDVWMDKSDMVAGEDWDHQIYEAISRSELVLLLLAENTGSSDWVRREVDVARGAQVFVLPVLIREGFDAGAVLDKFALPRKQYERYVEASEAEFARLRDSIEKNKIKTRDRQIKWLEQLIDGKNSPVFKEPHSPTHRSYAVYGLKEQPAACRIHLSAGDLIAMRNIEVLVNPENNYMQMARIFESATVSSKLRLNGSRMRGGQVREDTLQQELYDQITSDNYQIPVGIGSVVPTHAGHAESKLVKNGARYIFHVATVTVQPTRVNAFIPTDDEGIKEGVKNCLDKTIEMDDLRGVISPSGTARYAQEQEAVSTYKPLESIIFPLLSTGRGGREREVAQVAGTMVEAIRNYLLDMGGDPRLRLKNIYVCAFSRLDVETVEKVMNDLLARVKK